MVGSVTADILQSAALPLLLRLNAEGYELQAAATLLRVRPAERVTPELRVELARYKADLLLLIRCRDSGVCARRDVMRRQFDAAPAGRVPALLFRPDVPYVEGRCFSCGDALQRFRIGRCWRCALAWRLAAHVPVTPDLAEALDCARVT
jgi:hypothetical protein